MKRAEAEANKAQAKANEPPAPSTPPGAAYTTDQEANGRRQPSPLDTNQDAPFPSLLSRMEGLGKDSGGLFGGSDGFGSSDGFEDSDDLRDSDDDLESLDADTAGDPMSVPARTPSPTPAEVATPVTGWVSAMQLTIFRETASKIADDWLKAEDIKMSGRKRLTAAARDIHAYQQGKKDSKKIDVHQKRIE